MRKIVFFSVLVSGVILFSSCALENAVNVFNFNTAETQAETENKTKNYTDVSETTDEIGDNAEVNENKNMVKVADIASEYQVNESSLGILLDAVGCPYFDVSGFPYLEQNESFFRLLSSDAKTYPDDIKNCATKTAGGRIRFRTDADKMSITLKLSTLSDFGYMTRMGANGIDVYYGVGTEKTYLTSSIPTSRLYTFTVNLPEGENEYTVLLPIYASVEYVEIGLPAEAYIGNATPYTIEKPIVFYGGADIQGASASRPGLAFTEIVTSKLDANLVNLGFDCEDYADYSLARYISTLEMSAFVMNYDGNALAEELAENHYQFYKIIRDANPDLPIVIMSKCNVAKTEDDYDAVKRSVIKKTYERAVEEGDNNIYFIDGQTIYPNEMRDMCNAGNNTPNDLGMYYISEKVYEVLNSVLIK